MTARDTILHPLESDVRDRLKTYVDLLSKWQKTINLVAPSTMHDVWTRHVADSLQVQAAAPAANTWVDLGAGAGFPGIVTAILLVKRPGAHVHLVESDKRKAAFLQTVSRETQLPVTVHAMRIETFAKTFDRQVDAVSARALAPLQQLLDFAAPLLEAGAIGVFPKGQSAEAELTALSTPHRFDIASKPSRTDPAARVFLVRMRRLEEPAAD